MAAPVPGEPIEAARVLACIAEHPLGPLDRLREEDLSLPVRQGEEPLIGIIGAKAPAGQFDQGGADDPVHRRRRAGACFAGAIEMVLDNTSISRHRSAPAG
jgi:hypothetical protein